MQRHALPREGKYQFGSFVRDYPRMKRSIQQRGVHPEPADTAGRLGQPHFGEKLVAAGP